MKPTADEDQILTGQEAIDHMTDTWKDIGMGLVNVEVHEPWLIVRRSGGNYSAFISVVDGTAVTILDDGATTRHIPKEHHPGVPFTDVQADRLSEAMAAESTGVYPLPDDGVFAVGFRSDGEAIQIHVGLTDDTFELADG